MKTKPLLRTLMACAYLVAVVFGLLEVSGMVQAWQQLQQSRQASDLIATHMAQVHSLVQRNRTLLLQSLQTRAPGIPLAEVEANIQRVSSHWATTLPLIQEPEESWLAGAVAAQRTQYLQKGLLPVVQAWHVRGAAPGVQPLAAQAAVLYEPFAHSLNALRAHESERARHALQTAEQRWQAALQDFALLGSLLLLLSRLLFRLVPRSLA